MTIAPKSFLYSLDASTGVATITLNRPDKLNALTFEVYRELTDTFRALGKEPGVRAVVITGAGRAFCSGRRRRGHHRPAAQHEAPRAPACSPGSPAT